MEHEESFATLPEGDIGSLPAVVEVFCSKKCQQAEGDFQTKANSEGCAEDEGQIIPGSLVILVYQERKIGCVGAKE